MEPIEQQLARVARELEELREEYHDFAYAVSHDLSGPMRAIEGFSAIIAEDHAEDFDEATQKHFDYIIANADEAQKILAALLEYAYLNTRKLPFKECNFNEIFNNVKESLSVLIEDNQAQIQCNTLPTTFADKNQMNQLFFHLLQNALLYQKNDGTSSPEVDINCKERKEHWEFSIKDNGIGIKENQIDRIFKPLRRAVSSKKYTGIGMGLAIAKKILQHHQGKIWVDSIPDEGTTFYFTISKHLNDNHLV